MATATLLRQIQKGTRIAQKANETNGPNVIGFLAETGGLIVNGIGAVLGALFRGGGFALSRIWAWTVQATQFVWNFNWNQTEQQADAEIRNRLLALSGYWGGVAGQTVGWLICGALPGAVVTQFNPVMGAYILKKVGEEAADEIASEIAVAIEYSVRSLISCAFVKAYQNVRRWFFSENNAIAQVILGDRYAETRQNYLNNRSKSWSFAQAFEEMIESIPNPFVQEFVEEAVDEFADACIESGFVVAGAADEWLFEQKFAQTSILGSEEVIQIQPDRENEEEKILLAGPQNLLKPVIVQTLTQHQLIEGRDVGQLVGMPVAEYVRADPLTLRLNIELYNKRKPPYNYGRNQEVVRASFSIPNVSRAKIDWGRIKQVCGGPNGYLWGRFWACATLKSGRKIKIYAATVDEAKERVLSALQLTEDELNTLNFGEEPREGSRRTNPRLFKETTRVYPAYCTILNRELQHRIDVGRPTTRGNYIDRKYRFDLWLDRKPEDFEESLQELFRYSVGEE